MRLVPDTSDPMSLTELQDHGNQLLLDARTSAAEAMHQSIDAKWLIKGRYTPTEIRALRDRAHSVVAAWQKVERQLSELVREYEKAKRGY